jgi:hypothetical protein
MYINIGPKTPNNNSLFKIPDQLFELTLLEEVLLNIFFAKLADTLSAL